MPANWMHMWKEEPLLRTVRLVALVLFLATGILGMHVVAGFHSMSAAAASPVEVQVSAAEVHEHHHGHEDRTPEGAKPGGTPAASLHAGSCLGHHGSCPGMSDVHVVCMPAPGGSPVAVQPPSLVTFDVGGQAARDGPLPSYCYIPGSPSPGELSVSRT